MLYHLFIVNRSGGLIFNQDLSPSAPKLSSNDWLRLGSTFHSLHAIASQVAPVASAGIESLQMGDYKLQCYQTLTGIKFVLTADSLTLSSELQQALQVIYELYADYVLKNPFYELEMPIRCEQFHQRLAALAAGTSR